jgi:D-alanyl-lipoteichoic acid acyltransferase DltB (MBOAT superfamily)
LAYTLQIYFDFSGYCDMATGICMIMGFDLPINFDSPYKAVNILDFWKRWHITLTKFFTKYVYIPLGGNRRGKARMYLNFMVVFLVSGLWHGNGWNFILWGAMHGVLYVATRALIGNRGQKNDSGIAARLKAVPAVAATFIYVTVAWVFFRAPSIADALTLLTRIFTGGFGPMDTRISSCFQLDELWYIIKVTPIMKLSFAWDTCLWLFLIVGSVIIFFCRNAITIARTCRIGVKTTLITVFLLVWSVVSFAGVSTFLYMNF